ncbi:hypothetical protein OTB20_18240 [Streptomyces sp. H27-H1]|uniref:hypothetical protein n=1 Tax=Streptomyces sp. H27-H1 TaxID=2996461 RepID=UPI00226F7D13|nr:hypothetical protein [Streptomyces sp. H27-H1]MCY0928097.1 hypothetical protein [Streptomyces sp. H27-H1]
MPRRRPGALRAERGTYEDRRPPAWARELPPVDRLSPDAAAAAHWAGPGRADEVADLLGRYRNFLRRSGSPLLLSPSPCPACPGCALDDVAVVRDELGDLYRALPPLTRTALGRALRELDSRFRRRTLPDPDPPPAGWADWSGRPRAWWHRRLYEDG